MKSDSLMNRRDLHRTVGALCGLAAWPVFSTKLHGESRTDSQDERFAAKAREYLQSVMPTAERVKNFITRAKAHDELNPNGGFTFDPDLGWVGDRCLRPRGMDGSRWFADYEPDGARLSINDGGAPCRIHTYGDSFTHCSQVNDGETWQEYLAAHFREPVRNYGVGGFSVYQAYRRMLLVESRDPVKYIVLNIYDDDHFRNLESWRAIRWGAGDVGFTLPHVQVDVGRDDFKEVDNIIRKPEDVIKLRDLDFVWEHFKDDMTLKLMLATRGQGNVSEEWIEPPETIFGLPLDKTTPGKTTDRLRALHTEAALYASKKVVQLVERFVEDNHKQLMVILSYGRTNLRKCLKGEERFDRSFFNWIRVRGYHVADMLGGFAREFERSRLPIEDFIHRYYIGHHTPAGNHFTAMAVKDAMVEWLDPKPLPYR